MPPRLVFTVTTDLNYDQRMQRICGSLARAGYEVLLVGREWPGSAPLTAQPYQQHRLRCWRRRGKLFYFEFTLRLLAYLFTQRAAAWCAIDLDTALPMWARARLSNTPFVYDAHELFTEVPEVVDRPAVQWVWRQVERFIVPRAHLAYTVGPALAQLFKQRYGRPFAVIRNISRLQESAETRAESEGYVLYQGALNAGRGLEILLAAMSQVRGRLVICGEGDLSGPLRAQAAALGLVQSGQVEFRGYMLPADLREVTRRAAVGVLLLENQGLSYYYSLANKFFDYLHAGVPQVVVDFPEYRALNEAYDVAELVAAPLTPEAVAAALNRLLPGGDQARVRQLTANGIRARQELSWQHEETRLIALYAALPGCAIPSTV
ncbi:glycosyltransferase [Hymenobacter taeanensis]|uniref:Glycosyltransferase n=1 Tax=Hymenobacter taeanensis TaxID=2735321 RepID=A0A6M6BMJ1_9BACT|nr:MULTISPECIES: glycosyltransferase [Hymenobacter]QJX49014.1 glycosyltransferase [Hymenobacter taeanensis]UOQ81470.1 glycosyltransferase [Hymenobacter sp. 5414T-23]